MFGLAAAALLAAAAAMASLNEYHSGSFLALISSAWPWTARHWSVSPCGDFHSPVDPIVVPTPCGQ